MFVGAHTQPEIIQKMKNIITTIIVLLTILSFCTAMYAGESFTKTFDKEIINCSIENNSFNLDGLDLKVIGNKVLITTQFNYQPDNFTLICWLDESYYISGGFSHHRSTTQIFEPCNETNWICNPFEQCIKGSTISRFCINDCGRTKMDYKWCNHTESPTINLTNHIPIQIILDDEDEERGFFKWLWGKISNFFGWVF